MLRWPKIFALAGILFVVLVASGNACSVARAAEGCPPSVLIYYFKFQGGDTYIPGTAFDTSIVNSDGDTTRVAFDHEAGRLTLDAVGRLWAGERILERFDLSGVPLGTPVAATIEFSLNGMVLNRCGGGGCGVNFTATLATLADSVTLDASIPGPCDSCVREVNTNLTLPMIMTAGAPQDVAFAVLYHTTNVAWGHATVTGVYRISGLPPGVEAVGCSGANVTPVRRTTWGSVKTRYR